MFTVNLPPTDGWEQLRDWMVRELGARECKLDKLIECKLVAVKPLPRPVGLIFYERYRYATTK